MPKPSNHLQSTSRRDQLALVKITSKGCDTGAPEYTDEQARPAGTSRRREEHA